MTFIVDIKYTNLCFVNAGAMLYNPSKKTKTCYHHSP